MSNNSLTTRDALSYLRDVKERFKNSKHVYETFLEIMKDFKSSRYELLLPCGVEQRESDGPGGAALDRADKGFLAPKRVGELPV